MRLNEVCVVRAEWNRDLNANESTANEVCTEYERWRGRRPPRHAHNDQKDEKDAKDREENGLLGFAGLGVLTLSSYFWIDSIDTIDYSGGGEEGYK